jgi:hypothetical protein
VAGGGRTGSRCLTISGQDEPNRAAGGGHCLAQVRGGIGWQSRSAASGRLACLREAMKAPPIGLNYSSRHSPVAVCVAVVSGSTVGAVAVAITSRERQEGREGLSNRSRASTNQRERELLALAVFLQSAARAQATDDHYGLLWDGTCGMEHCFSLLLHPLTKESSIKCPTLLW